MLQSVYTSLEVLHLSAGQVGLNLLDVLGPETEFDEV